MRGTLTLRKRRADIRTYCGVSNNAKDNENNNETDNDDDSDDDDIIIYIDNDTDYDAIDDNK